MKRNLGWFILIFLITTVTATLAAFAYQTQRVSVEEFELLGEDIPDTPLTIEEQYRDWVRPPGPLKVTLQVGHWNNDDFPEELARLRGNTGAIGGGKVEWQVNHAIAQATKPLLEAKGIVVEILPATVPPDHYADLFIAIHADGSPSPGISGFKVASPRRDLTGKGAELVAIFEREYQAVTGFEIDPNVTRNMRGYYAFNWRRYEHSIHPMTPAIILETGFLTSPHDQRILINNPDRAAQGIAQAVLSFFNLNQPDAATTTQNL